MTKLWKTLVAKTALKLKLSIEFKFKRQAEEDTAKQFDTVKHFK